MASPRAPARQLNCTYHSRAETRQGIWCGGDGLELFHGQLVASRTRGDLELAGSDIMPMTRRVAEPFVEMFATSTYLAVVVTIPCLPVLPPKVTSSIEASLSRLAMTGKRVRRARTRYDVPDGDGLPNVVKPTIAPASERFGKRSCRPAIWRFPRLEGTAASPRELRHRAQSRQLKPVILIPICWRPANHDAK